MLAATAAPEPVVEFVPQAILNRMTSVLMEIIGPMAPLVLRDQLKALGVTATNLPAGKLNDLIMLIGLEIADSKLKKKFEETIGQELASFKGL